MLHAVIMAGGSGTRFWPQSRKKMPKQLLRLAGSRTMIQQTADRCKGWVDSGNIWVVTNDVQADATKSQLPEIKNENVLLEPAARNTAPCVGLAAVQIQERDPDGIMFVLPADHVIKTDESFAAAARRAVDVVEEDSSKLILFGVIPTFPATGYGYIERSDALSNVTPRVYHVSAFREKPHRELAEEYLRAGRYFWNCGIFCWKAQTIVDLLEQYEPELHAGLMRISKGIRENRTQQVMAEEFPALKSISIDYAVLERAQNVVVIEAPFQWDDVGSWLSLPRLNGCDTNGNTIDGPFCGIDTQGCIIRTTDQHLIATLGLRNLIIVHTGDTTLVADAAQAERIKEIMGQLEKQGLQEFL